MRLTHMLWVSLAGIEVTMENPIISINHAHKTFTQGGKSKYTHTALEDVSLSVETGDIMGIIGYSGAGKSTLVRLINGLEKVDSGNISVFDKDITHLSETQLRPFRQKIGMIFQQFNLFSSKTVAQNIAYPLAQDRWRRDFQERRVAKLLDYVGLSEYAHAYPSQLSGGQKQRVGIARALALQPKILLADEATSALDPKTTQEVLNLLKRVNAELGITVVLITHQMDVVAKIAKHVAVMETARIVEQGPAFKIFARPQTSITQNFVRAAVDCAPTKEELEVLRAQHPGRLISVIMRDEDALNGIASSGDHISAMLTHRSITNAILCGGVKMIGDKSLGTFTYELYGDVSRMDEYISDLARENTIVDFGSAEHPIPWSKAYEAYQTLDEKRCSAYSNTAIDAN